MVDSVHILVKVSTFPSTLSGLRGHTWRHVKRRATSVVTGYAVRGGKSKIGQFHGMAMVGYQDILRLEIAMIDSHGMTELDGIQDLQECMLGKMVVPNEAALFGDVGEQVTLRTEFEYHESTIGAVEYSNQGHHVGMLASSMVKSYLSALDPSLASIQAGLRQCLDGIGDVGQDIDSLVHDSKGTDSKDGDKLQASG